MKTTIDIADPLFVAAKSRAHREGRTLKDVVEQALRNYLQGSSGGTFRLRDATFRGKGLQPGIDEGDWEHVRSLIYRV